jgi:hypothetical protein
MPPLPNGVQVLVSNLVLQFEAKYPLPQGRSALYFDLCAVVRRHLNPEEAPTAGAVPQSATERATVEA